MEKKPNKTNRIADLTKPTEAEEATCAAAAAAVAAPEALADRIGGLTEEQVRTLLHVMPKDAWFLVNNLFFGNATTFSAGLVKPAATVQSFIVELLNHPTFAASA